MSSKIKKQHRKRLAVPSYSNGGVGVACGAAVADGGGGGGGGQDVFCVVLRLGERVEDARLHHPHHGVGPVLEGPDLDHLDHLVLGFLPLGQRLARLLRVLFQVAVHPTHLIWREHKGWCSMRGRSHTDVKPEPELNSDVNELVLSQSL